MLNLRNFTIFIYKKFNPLNTLFVFTAFLYSCQPSIPEDIATSIASLPQEIDYNQHVKPILSDKCFACHGPDKNKRKAGLQLNTAEAAFAELPDSQGKVAIDPGDIGDSEVFFRIISMDPKKIMPTPESHLSLTAYEKAVLIKWIQNGAEYKTHWAFVKPELPDVPDVKNEAWIKNPIDNFILSKIEEKNLKPSPQADKSTLLRRLSFDLTGLPPSQKDIQNFTNDKSPNAYEKVVDRLLASPNYGEKMATEWLDVARFADTHGYTVDRYRDMSPYRDWVIASFNKNQKYDQFIHWQLAGDLMPKPSQEMLIATAFNRNHQQNMEGGIIEEEFQTEYVIDRTNTLGDAFLGLSVGCAKCHDHKYDPISQKNYYQLFSFFNNVREAGQISWDDALPTPTLMLPTAQQQKIIQFLNTDLTIQNKKIDVAKQAGYKDFENWLNTNKYQSLANVSMPKVNLLALFDFDQAKMSNGLNPKQKCFTTRAYQSYEPEKITQGKTGKGIHLNGDAWLEFNSLGVFRKSDPFTIGMNIKVPKEFKEGVIFHKGFSERLYNFRGFHLYIKKEGILEATMAHTAPSNAFTLHSKIKVPRDKWTHLSMTYSGSGKASGMKIYLDGKPIEMEIITDQLTKDILFPKSMFKNQPGLQVGGWDRGYGLKNGLVDDIVVYNRALVPFEVGVLAGRNNWQQIASKSNTALNATEKAVLKEYYFSALHKPTLLELEKIRQKRAALADSTEDIKELMVMQEMPNPKQAHILIRGNYDALGEKVYPSTPENILLFAENLPKNRYGLAQWLTNEKHPLTARVAVNRMWQNIFGTGLVKTAEDFGNQGEMPSHPELLDYLSVYFVQSGWDVKKLVKFMVMSSTYQQDSKPRKDLLVLDAENRLWAKGPSSRLTAEMMRDNALAAAGLLKNKIGGKSVKPYQPYGLWEINNTSYIPDSSDEVYRRSLYVFIKRSVPHPTLNTFDGPSRSACTIRRQKTNTPLQALLTLNDPAYVETCKVLGEKMARANTLSIAIKDAFQKLTGRLPSDKELVLLSQYHKKSYLKFKQDPSKTKGWLNAGYYKIDTSLEPALIASNTVIASVILNSDATLMKR